MNSNDSSEQSGASELSLTGLRFVESIFRTAGGRKISIDHSVDGSEEEDFEESVIINKKYE